MSIYYMYVIYSSSLADNCTSTIVVDYGAVTNERFLAQRFVVMLAKSLPLVGRSFRDTMWPTLAIMHSRRMPLNHKMVTCVHLREYNNTIFVYQYVYLYMIKLLAALHECWPADTRKIPMNATSWAFRHTQDDRQLLYVHVKITGATDK